MADLDLSEIIGHVTPLLTSMLSLMITFQMVKMLMGMVREFRP